MVGSPSRGMCSICKHIRSGPSRAGWPSDRQGPWPKESSTIRQKPAGVPRGAASPRPPDGCDDDFVLGPLGPLEGGRPIRARGIAVERLEADALLAPAEASSEGRRKQLDAFRRLRAANLPKHLLRRT